MLDRTIVLGMIAACMLATPVAAQAPAPATTAFDGTYVGVSRTLEGSMTPNETRVCTVPNGQPGPLTIAGGVVRWPDHVGVGGVIHPPLVICRVVPRQILVPRQSRRHGQQDGRA
jgi:hypothetical protein